MLTMLTNAELERLRADALALLPSTVVILHPTATVDAYGAFVEAWGTAGTVVGRIDPYKQQGSETIGGADKGSNYYQLTVPYDAPLLDGDRVSVDNVTYEVKQLSTGHSLRMVRRAIIARHG